MPSTRPRVYGLSKEVTLAVLPRLYMQEVLLELGRRDIDFRQVLLTTLRDVMVREYQQIDSDSDTPPDVTCHVTRRMGYGFCEPSSWTGELAGRPVARSVQSPSWDSLVDTPTDLSVRTAASEETREPQGRDPKVDYHIVTVQHTDRERWTPANTYTEYNTRSQEFLNNEMSQGAEKRQVFDRPSSGDEEMSPLGSREEHVHDLSTSTVSHDERFRGQEQGETDITPSSNASVSLSSDTRPYGRHTLITTAPSTCTVPQETRSQYRIQPDNDVSDTSNHMLSFDTKFRHRRHAENDSGNTRNPPASSVVHQAVSCSQRKSETGDAPRSDLSFPAALVQKKSTSKRKTDNIDGGKSSPATLPEDVPSKRPKENVNGPTTPAISEKEMPPENEVVRYRDLCADAPSEAAMLPYWAQAKGSYLHIESVSSIPKDRIHSWKKETGGEMKGEEVVSRTAQCDKMPTSSLTASESSATTASHSTTSATLQGELSSSPALIKVATHHRHLHLQDGAIPVQQHPPIALQSQKIVLPFPRPQEREKAPAEENQTVATIPQQEASPTSRQPECVDAPTCQLPFPAVPEKLRISSQRREEKLHKRDSSLSIIMLPGMASYRLFAKSEIPREEVDSYHREEESRQHHATIAQRDVTPFRRRPENDGTHLQGVRVDSRDNCTRNSAKEDDITRDRLEASGLSTDIDSHNPNELKGMGAAAQGNVLSLVLYGAPLYKRRMEHNGSPAMDPPVSTMQAVQSNVRSPQPSAVSTVTAASGHSNPKHTGLAHKSTSFSYEAQVNNNDKHPLPTESMRLSHQQVENRRVHQRNNQASEEQHQEQRQVLLTQKDLNFVIKQEPLTPLSDCVNGEERRLIQGVLSTSSAEAQAVRMEQQAETTTEAETEGLAVSETQTGAEKASSSSGRDPKSQRVFRCPLCSYFTCHRGNVKQHMRVHTGERPYKCPLCDYSGARKEHVEVHMKRHTGERPFKCGHCDYRTCRKPDLVKHLRVHSGDRPYACPKCEYRAAVQSALVNHLRTHKGERPHKCPICNHASTRRRDLFRHMGKHTEEEKNRAHGLNGTDME